MSLETKQISAPFRDQKLLNTTSVTTYRNEQYYEAILSIWNQLYINVKSLIAWQYCMLDIKRINSLTISMVRGIYLSKKLLIVSARLR